MKIIICGSISLSDFMISLSKELEDMGHEVTLPYSTQKIQEGAFTLSQHETTKDKSARKIKHDLIRNYYEAIKKVDAVLIANIDKNGVKHYIGGNAFLEMAFAHVLKKKLYIYNTIPEMNYTAEIKAMQPIVLNGDLSKLKK